MSAAVHHSPFALYPPAADRAAWEGIPARFRREIRDLADSYAAIPWPMRKATDFLAFVKTGSRTADEDPYFLRRRKLCAAALGKCADPARSPDEVIDGIWAICEETSWVISAHNVNPVPGAPAPAEVPLPDPDMPYIDLFSAQTGMILSFVCDLLAEDLEAVSSVLRRRAAKEIRRRILEPFMRRDDFWWMGVLRKDLNNWTPWILSNVMICAGYGMEENELPALLDRAGEMLERYMACLPGDGGCDEGAGYWNMAGGALLDCLEMLEKWRGVSRWKEPKIRNILSFPMKAELGGGWFLNFADCDARPFLCGERIQTAGEKLGIPALTAMGLRYRGSIADQLSDVPHLSRALSLLFHPEPEEKPETPESGDVWLPDLQVRVVRRGGLTLGCKGGHNGESHNHNDVGTFLLYADGEPEIVDAGNMVYTAKTFSEARYTLWNTRSAFHNLPMIGGAEQAPGTEYAAAEVRCLEDGLSLRMDGAWPEEAGVLSWRRTWTLTEDGMEMTDEAELREPKPVTWVFLLRHEPDPENPVRFGGLEMTLPEGMTAEKERIDITDPRMARNWPGCLWRMTVTARTPAARLRESFSFRKRNAD